MAGRIQKFLIGDQEGRLLPKDRKTQTKYLIKDHYGKLITLSVFTFLCMLPSIVVAIIMSFNQAEALKKAEESAYGSIIFNTNLSLMLYLIPCVLLIALGLGGLFNFIKRLVWDERVSYKDFFIGIKLNWWKFILLSYFAYIFIFMFVIAISYYGFNSSWHPLLRYTIIALTGIVCFFANLYVLNMMSIVARYETTLKQLFGNGFRLTFYHLFRNIGVSLIVFVPWVVNLFIPSYYQFIIFALEMVFLIGLSILCVEEYHASVFDDAVNKDNYPDIYRKGLLTEQEVKEMNNEVDVPKDNKEE